LIRQPIQVWEKTMGSKIRYAGRTALVTGASSGIGAAFARGLAARGSNVVLVARREPRLKQLAAEVEREHGVTAHHVVADLTDEGAFAAVHQATESLGLRVDTLVNNAGFGAYGRFETVPAERGQDMIMVNVAAYVGLTRRYLPQMIAEGDGIVVNVSSGAAFQPMSHQIVYAASKAFVQSFSEGLWAENRKNGVRVIATVPFATDTEYFDVVGNHKEAKFGKAVPPAHVVDATVRALDRGRMYTVIGSSSKVMVNVPRLLPRMAYAKLVEGMTRPR
jgi:short-subunit dehydrogenase